MPRRSELNGIAADLLNSFVSRNNDVDGYWGMGKLYAHAREHEIGSVLIALAPVEQAPCIEPLSSIAKGYRHHLVSLMQRRKLPLFWLHSAAVSVEFDSLTAKPQFFGTRANGRPFLCSMEVKDDLGRRHIATASGWCAPHDKLIETQSTRAQ